MVARITVPTENAGSLHLLLFWQLRVLNLILERLLVKILSFFSSHQTFVVCFFQIAQFCLRLLGQRFVVFYERKISHIHYIADWSPNTMS